MDIKVNYAMLERLESRVAEIIEEFEQASARREDLVAAVGRPDGHGELQNRVHDFEGQWDDRRKQLREGLDAVLESATKLREGWQTGDKELADGMQSEEQ